jgi:hypothetical protein
MGKNNMNKKGMEAEILMKWLIAIFVLLAILAVIYILRGGTDNMLSKLLEKLRFG